MPTVLDLSFRAQALLQGSATRIFAIRLGHVCPRRERLEVGGRVGFLLRVDAFDELHVTILRKIFRLALSVLVWKPREESQGVPQGFIRCSLHRAVAQEFRPEGTCELRFTAIVSFPLSASRPV